MLEERKNEAIRDISLKSFKEGVNQSLTYYDNRSEMHNKPEFGLEKETLPSKCQKIKHISFHQRSTASSSKLDSTFWINENLSSVCQSEKHFNFNESKKKCCLIYNQGNPQNLKKSLENLEINPQNKDSDNETKSETDRNIKFFRESKIQSQQTKKIREDFLKKNKRVNVSLSAYDFFAPLENSLVEEKSKKQKMQGITRQISFDVEHFIQMHVSFPVDEALEYKEKGSKNSFINQNKKSIQSSQLCKKVRQDSNEFNSIFTNSHPSCIKKGWAFSKTKNSGFDKSKEKIQKIVSRRNSTRVNFTIQQLQQYKEIMYCSRQKQYIDNKGNVSKLIFSSPNNNKSLICRIKSKQNKNSRIHIQNRLKYSQMLRNHNDIQNENEKSESSKQEVYMDHKIALKMKKERKERKERGCVSFDKVPVGSKDMSKINKYAQGFVKKIQKKTIMCKYQFLSL